MSKGKSKQTPRDREDSALISGDVQLHVLAFFAFWNQPRVQGRAAASFDSGGRQCVVVRTTRNVPAKSCVITGRSVAVHVARANQDHDLQRHTWPKAKNEAKSLIDACRRSCFVVSLSTGNKGRRLTVNVLMFCSVIIT